MSNFPNNFDDDTTLPFVNDNITEIGGDAINALRDAVFALEQNVGLNAQGTTTSIADRFGISINPDGTLRASAIVGLGLVTLPITDGQISDSAQIAERKLFLDHKTQDLFNYIRDLSGDVNLALGWISTTGIKLEPHLVGAIYRHTMDQIDVADDASLFLQNKFRALRNNLNSYTLASDINNELLAHQWADGSPFGDGYNVTTNNGSVYSDFYAHTGSGIFINTSRFNNIPQSADDVQLFVEYIDSASIFLLGTRIQNLYTAGISRISRASSLTTDGYGQFIIPPTAAIAYLKNIGNSSNPVDDINHGDDIIQFTPPLNDGYAFDEKWALVKVGDIVRINYGTIEVPFLIKEKKYSASGGGKTFIIRIAGKNLAYQPNAIARIDRPLFNNNKYGELSISPVNNFAGTPSLIINNPRGAQTLGLGFNPAQFDENHYILYLAFYPTGFAQDGYVILPGIDVTGNKGTTPGLYTLESVVQATNNAFRANGYNYRFTAFSYQGEFGICLAESYNNSGFSILSVPLKADGTIDTLANQVSFINNVVDLLPTVGTVAPDPLGIGPFGAAVASPPFYTTYGSSAASQNPTKLFIPLRRMNYYVNGAETERLAKEDSQALDGYGDGYWVGTIFNVNILPTRVETTYRIPLDLSTSGLKAGKTIVVQQLTSGSLVDFGRFIIESVSLGCCSPSNFTDIVVYDAVHAKGFSPATTLGIGAGVNIYFGSDSVSFNDESATDAAAPVPATTFKRHFEVYVDDDGETFTHERGRMSLTSGTVTVNGVVLNGFSQIGKADLVRISPKLRGYQFGSVNKITLTIFNYSDTTGTFDGYLCSYDGTSMTHVGPHIFGRKGEVTRFYDETSTDYIDIIWDINTVVSAFTNQVTDFQLFPSLQLDDELLLLGTCQVDDGAHQATRIQDARQFGNTSEKDLSSSVFEFLAAPERYLHANGVIRGFDVANTFGGTRGTIDIAGGIVLVDGKIFNINNKTVSIPFVREMLGFNSYPINWALCIDKNGDYATIPLLDYDSTISTPNSPTRIMSVTDPNSAVTYNIQGLTFTTLITNRRDLTILYIVSAVYSGTQLTVTLTAKDARKFNYRKDWGYVPTLADTPDNGDFRSFSALGNWLNFNSTYNNTVRVKGTFVPPAAFTYNNAVTFNGDGQATFTPTNTTTFTNLTLNNLTISWGSPQLTFVSCTFNNCTFTNTGASNPSFINCQVSNCTFSHTVSTLINYAGSSFNGCTFNYSSTIITTFNSSNFIGCTFNFLGANCQVLSTLGSSVPVYSRNNFSIQNSMVGFTLIGNILDNNFTWFSSSGPITIGGSSPAQFFNLSDNKFNTFNGTLSTEFVTIPDASNGIISRNQFYRLTNSLSGGYIQAPASYTSGVVSIINNFFDLQTINGTDQNLVKNLPIPWIYSNNLNTPPTIVGRVVSASTYTVVVSDYLIELTLAPNTGCTVNLPSIALSPPGRTLIIKDVLGNADTSPIILHKANSSETIENLTSDYLIINPYASIVLVAGTSGWIII